MGSSRSRSRSRARYGGGWRPGQKHKARNTRMTVPRKKLGFPQSLRTTLRYVTTKKFDVTSFENVQYESFRANGMFDPEVSLGGHQPRGFDQCMALYKSFTVLGSKISINVVYDGYDGPATVSPSAAIDLMKTVAGEDAAPALSPAMIGIITGVDILALPLTAAELMEHDRVLWKPITSPTGAIVLKKSCNIGSFFGKSNLVGAEGYSGSAAVDPTEQPQFTVFAGRMNASASGLVRLTAYVTIEYDAVFTEPKILQES